MSEQFNLAEKKLAILYRVTESISTKILLCVRSMLPEALRKEKVLQVSCCVELDILLQVRYRPCLREKWFIGYGHSSWSYSAAPRTTTSECPYPINHLSLRQRPISITNGTRTLAWVLLINERAWFSSVHLDSVNRWTLNTFFGALLYSLKLRKNWAVSGFVKINKNKWRHFFNSSNVRETAELWYNQKVSFSNKKVSRKNSLLISVLLQKKYVRLKKNRKCGGSNSFKSCFTYTPVVLKMAFSDA